MNHFYFCYRYALLILCVIACLPTKAQNPLVNIVQERIKQPANAPNYTSIHHLQSEFYKQYGELNQAQYDSLDLALYPSHSAHPTPPSNMGNGAASRQLCDLSKQVYGWHPYWATTTQFNNYDYSLLSTLCYFSYELVPSTGSYSSIHAWKTTNAITLAQAAGSNVDLCVTNFGSTNNTTFLNNSTAWGVLTDSLISLLNYRNANGVNIDFEGMGSSHRVPFTNFMTYFCNRLHTERPGTKVSMALYAVDWSNSFDIAALNAVVDAFIIMGYDYHYSGGSAGPGGPLHHGSAWSGYTYTQNRSVNYYLNQGVTPSKLLLGVPYYGIEWPTADSNVPTSSTTGTGTSRTYNYVRNNYTGTYSYQWDQSSLTPYYAFQSAGQWKQCWYDDENSLGERYDMVLDKNIGGIGIWALGYDDGYNELWDEIYNHFTTCASRCTDNAYDTSGPLGNYLNNENYSMTYTNPNTSGTVSIAFNSFNLELNYDYLYIYDGASTAAPLIGTYTGSTLPPTINSTSNNITVRFTSDGATVNPGFELTWQCVNPTCTPATVVNPLNNWYTADFNATFTDTPCPTLDQAFYQVQDYNGTQWRCNGARGYLADDFNNATIHSDFTAATGVWAINSNAAHIADETQSNTNLYTAVTQTAANTYLYEWSGKMSGTGTNRRSGLHFFCDNATGTPNGNRGNSYLIWWRADQDKLEFYETTADVLNLVKTVNLTVDADVWYDYRVTYNPATGVINVWRNGVFIDSYTDATPLTTGAYVSLRNGNCQAWFDNVRVSRLRTSPVTITMGNALADLRYQSPNPSTDACRILTIAKTSTNIWTAIDTAQTKIDWTAPSTVVVNDGTSADIDITNTATQLSANWNAATEPNSGLITYWYAIGTTSGGTNIVNWTNNGTNTNFTQSGLTLINGTTYYISVKSDNGAGLTSAVSTSDGIQYQLPCAIPTNLSVSAVGYQTATLTWTAVGNATAYNLRYKPTSSSTWTVLNLGNITTTSLTLQGCTAYEVQVETVCSGSTTSGYSASVNFTTTLPNPAWTAPPSLRACDPAINLNSYITGTAGGTFSGTGVSSNTFNPSGLSVGNYNVTYTVGSGTCAATQTQTISVTASPSATFTGTSLAQCSAALNLNTLITGTAGGTFSGTGVSSNTFNPSGLSVGNYTISYTVGSGTCTATQTQTISVTASPSAAFTGTSLAQCSAALNLNTLITGTTGGTFSGTGVSSNTFNPSGLSVGSYSVTYTVGSGTCAATQTQTISVTASPSATFTGTSLAQCSAALNLNTLVTGTAGGTFSGTGVSSNTFNPSGLSVGNYSVTYTVGSGTCAATQTQTISVTASPSAAFTGTSLAQCSAALNLNTLVTGTAGGTFSGTGVSSNTFNPSGLSVGNYNVTYTVGSGTCTATQTQTISVTASPSAAFTGTSLAQCSAALNLNTLITGTTGGTFSGTGVSSNTFNTSGLSVGSYSVTYTVGSGTCAATQTQTISVTASPSATFTGTSLAQCSAALNLNTLITGTAGGTFSGTGVSSNTFNPSGLSVGNYSVTYTVGSGTCAATQTQSIVVTASPSATFTGTSLAQCSAALNLNTLITGTTGGTFSGTGVSSNTFNPSGLSVGNYSVTYTVGSGTCAATQTQSIVVTASPSAAFTGTSLAQCSAALNLNTLITGTAGGTFSGTGVSSNTFNPSGLSVGNYSVTYTVGSGTCTATQTQTISVTASPSAAFTGTSLAQCSAALNLNTLVTGTAGGTFSGTGVSSNTFNPSGLSVGNYSVTYTVGSGTCAATQTQTISVTASPSAAFTGTSLAQCSAALNLNTLITGTAGGTFSGTGVSSNTFNPSGLSVGNYNVTYTVGSGTCVATQTQTISVTASPSATFTGTSLAQCSAALNLNTLITGTTGGTFSGTGVSSNTFNPSGLSVGNYSVTYTVGSGTCAATQTQSIVVTASPSAAFTGTSLAQCSAALNLNTLITGTAGGTFSGTGVSSNTFNPSGLSVGNYSVTYTVGSGTCTATQTQTISVTASPSAAFTGTSLAQCSAALNLTTLVTGTAGGTFSGTGVSSNTFNPSGLSVGNYSVTYTVGSGTCAATQTQTISVTASPSAAFTGTSLAQCSAALNLNTLITGTAGGTFSGTGVSSNTFNPSGLSVGNYNVTYTVGSGTCAATQTQTINVTACPPSGLQVRLRVFLQGPYRFGLNVMTTDLRNIGTNILPLSQPYNTAPWNYGGAEAFANVTAIPTDMTDWVLVELRQMSNNTLVATQVGCLKADGSLWTTSGFEGLYFNVNAGNYRIIVRHRNHLAVASAAGVAIPTVNPYDFTVAANVAGGTTQLADLNGNATLYGLFSGDNNADGIISVADYNVLMNQVSQLNVYLTSDVNLNRSVLVDDFNLYQPNASRIGVSWVRW
jgi:spore germination protein YaaH